MATRIYDPEYHICMDCIQIVFYDDPSGLDYQYSPEEAYLVESKIRKEIHDLQRDGISIALGDREKDIECEVGEDCGHCNRVAMTLHHCTLLQEE